MSTITDFDGVVAAAEIQGRPSGSDGTSYTFDADMRFMKGRYVATDGRLREAASASSELTSSRAPWATRQGTGHDFEPGILPSGLFWTVPIGRSAIASQPARGRARFAEARHGRARLP